jgi:hypothetical protein
VLTRRTFRILALLIAIYAALWFPAVFWSDYLDTPFGVIAAIPMLSIYFFNMLGIPGLLKSGGACGWGWCAPTTGGWIFMVAFWLLLAWLVAWGIGSAFRNRRSSQR